MPGQVHQKEPIRASMDKVDWIKLMGDTSSDSLVLVHSTLGSHREAGLVPDSKVSISANRQFYQL